MFQSPVLKGGRSEGRNVSPDLKVTCGLVLIRGFLPGNLLETRIFYCGAEFVFQWRQMIPEIIAC